MRADDMDLRTMLFISIIAAFVSLLPFGCHELTVRMRWHERINARAAVHDDVGSCDAPLVFDGTVETRRLR